MKELLLDRPDMRYKKSFENYTLAYQEISDIRYFNMYKKALEDFPNYLNDLYNHSQGKNYPKDG